MLFNSYIFVLLFLPLAVAGYFLLNRRRTSTAAHIYLLGMSLWFYGYFNPAYLPVILVSVCCNFGFYRLMGTSRRGVRTAAVTAAAALNIGILFYFKYYDFFLENVNALFGSSFTLRRLVLPLGISFFTFQQLSFIIDAYRGEVGKYGFLDYALFVTYFPQLIAGPIVTHDELVPQFQDEAKRRLSWDSLARGLYLFTLGMGKKVLLADTFGSAANWGFAHIGSLNSLSAAAVMLSYTVQIYFDFSGYCDMAMGIGRMMNIDLPLNFDSPYKARTITEFWDRWHMTLTRFFTRYVYIPLGGSRRGEGRTYINMMIVFLVSGLWHGANWTFVLWGAVHGAFSVLTKRFKSVFDRMPGAVSWLITFLFVNLAWVLFRADSIADAGRLIGRIFAMTPGPINANILESFNLVEFAAAAKLVGGSVWYGPGLYVCCGLFTAAAVWLLRGRNAWERAERFEPGPVRCACTAALLLWCICSFSGVTTFLYFNF